MCISYVCIYIHAYLYLRAHLQPQIPWCFGASSNSPKYQIHKMTVHLICKNVDRFTVHNIVRISYRILYRISSLL